MICILGGTFDPVHYGHLRTAVEVQQALGLEKLLLLPSFIPPHRDEPSITAQQRLALLNLAIASEPALQIDQRELDRAGRSFMVDTLASYREQAGDEPVCLLLGLDALLGLHRWHQWESIPELAHLLVMERPGYDFPDDGPIAALLDKRQVETMRPLFQQPAGLIYTMPVTRLDIASTTIRQLLAAGMNARYLLPDKVLEKIKSEGWYLHQ
ncbi:MAG: nicotinate-nucleotide adenylyltransferase [Gammaproteobacteria bacterium]